MFGKYPSLNKKAMKNLILFTLALFSSNLLWAQWEPDVRLTFDTAISTSSQWGSWGIASRGDTVHVVWYDKRDDNYEIYYKRSTDAGLTWGADTRLTNDLSYSRLPSIALSGSLVHIVWKDNRDGHYETYYKRSVNRGETWENDVRLTNTPSYNSNTMSVSACGLWVHVVWSINNSPLGPVIIRYKNSADGGLTWGPETWVTGALTLAFNPTVACSETNVYIVWRDVNSKHLFFNHSLDGGLIWGDETQLTDDLAIQPNYPSISVSGSVVHVVWNDRRDGDFRIYYKRSGDGGLTWCPDTRLTNNLDIETPPNIASKDSVINIVWQDLRNANYDIYFLRSSDAGLSWEPETQLTNDALDSKGPSVSISGSLSHVSWMDDRDGNFEIFYKRNPIGGVITGMNNGFSSINGNRMYLYPNPASTDVHFRFSDISERNSIITIQTILGEEICSRPIQDYETVVDVSNLPNGLYFAGIKAGKKQTATKKLIILK